MEKVVVIKFKHAATIYVLEEVFKELPALSAHNTVGGVYSKYLHNEDGPAVIYGASIRYFWLYGQEYEKKEWEQEVEKIKRRRAFQDKLKVITKDD